MRHFLLFIFSGLISLSAVAQLSPGLHLSRDLWNSRMTNPAIVQPYDVIVALPGIQNDLGVDGMRYGDLFGQRGDRLVVDAGLLLGRLGERVDLRESAEVPTFGFSFFVGKTNLSISHAVRFDAAAEIPRTLPELLWRGNAPFIGQTVQIDPKLTLSSYHRVQLSAARELMDGLTAGISANLVSSINALQTERFDLALTTDDDIYALTLASDILLHSAGLLDYNGLDDVRLQSPLERLTAENLLRNPAVTLDVGLRYQRANWDFAFSALNVSGAVLNFNENQATTYVGRQSTTYSGIDGNALIVGGEAVDFNAALDTLTQIFALERQVGLFTIPLPQQFYLSGLYQLGNDWEFGAALAIDSYRFGNTTTATVLARYRILEQLRAGLSYGTHRGRFDQVGVQVYGQLGPVQLFALTEDLLGLLNLDEARRVQFRVGANLLFGERE